MAEVERPGVTETKIIAPRPRADAVVRGRLIDLVDQQARLAVVVAPAGSGKTTFLAQLAADRTDKGEAVTWLSLDANDHDPARFWTHLLGAMKRVGVTVAEATRPETRPVAALVNALAAHEGRVTIVLDDYHTVPGHEVDADVGALVESLPTGVQVVIATRVDPALPTPRLRVRGHLAEVRVADLNFTVDETSELFEMAFQVTLEPQQVGRLQGRTEGWAAALYVAGLGLRRSQNIDEFVEDFSGNQAHLVDYLNSEIIELQDAETLDFLLRTCILTGLSAELCDAVLLIDTSAVVLEQLQRTNLFVIGLDDSRKNFRYHHLFREVLKARLDRSDDIDTVALHSRAGEWFAAHNDPTAAVWHFVAARCYSRARDVINDSWFPHINGGHAATVWGWLDLVPADFRNLDPLLCRLAAWAKLNLGAYGEIPALLEVGELGDSGPLSARAEAEVIRSHMERHLGNAAGALGHATTGRADCVGAQPLLRAAAECALGVAEFWAGHHDTAGGLLEHAADMAASSGEDASLIAALGHHGLLLAVSRDPGEAERLATRSLRLCRTRQLETFHVPVAAHLALARTQLDARRLTEAATSLVRAGELAAEGREPLAEALASVWLAELHAVTGDRDTAMTKLTGPSGPERSAKSGKRLRSEGGTMALSARTLRRAEDDLSRLRDPGWVATEAARVRNDIRFGPRSLEPAVLPVQPLTDRELVVLRMLTGTGTRQDIADELHISLATAKTHIHAIARKLGTSKREDIVRKARRLDLIP